MFNNFDGNFRRRPQQNLSGLAAAARRQSDRLSIIRNAQQGRQKREEARRQQSGATVIQSSVRSFVQRQQWKRTERERFDQYRTANGLGNVQDLEFLGKRIVFFFHVKDAEDADRLAFLCQFMINNPEKVLPAAALDPIWTYRIKKILGLCLQQSSIPERSPTTLRQVMEIYASNSSIDKYLPKDNPDVCRSYLENVFCYLIQKRYFKVVRQLFEAESSSVNSNSASTSNPGTTEAALLQMLLQPLKLLPSANNSFDKNMLQSFTVHILSVAFSEQIKNLIIPSLARMSGEFPYISLIRYIADAYQTRLDQQNANAANVEDDDAKCETSTGGEGVSKKSRKNRDQDTLELSTRKHRDQETLELSTWLLYSVMKLGEDQLDNLNSEELYGTYIKVLASMINNISKLPRQASKKLEDASSDTESESEDASKLTSMESQTLTSIIAMLNESKHVAFIAQHVDTILERTELKQHLCLICHTLLTYNESAVDEYDLLKTLAAKPQFVRVVS